MRPQLSPCFLSSSTSLRRNIPVTLSMTISCRINTLLSFLRENTEYMNSFSLCITLFRSFDVLISVLISKSLSCCPGRGASNFKNIEPKTCCLIFQLISLNQAKFILDLFPWLLIFLFMLHSKTWNFYFEKLLLYPSSLNFFHGIMEP